MIAAAIALDRSGVIPSHLTWGGLVPTGATLAVFWPLLMFKGRGVMFQVFQLFHSALISGETSRGAVLARLTGSYPPAKALAVARDTFCVLPADALSAADFANPSPHDRHLSGLGQDLDQTNATVRPDEEHAGNDGSGPTMNTGLAAQTVKIALGEADGFICHSWHDDADQQFQAVSRWAATFRDENDSRCPMIWFDRACIDAVHVGRSLACLPVYLAGCKQLVVLAGPTFSQRLWCTMVSTGDRKLSLCTQP